MQGPDAGAALNRLCTANVDGAEETITYTQWLDDDGKLQGDVTVAKLGGARAGEFLVVVTDTQHRHGETWMKRHIADAGAAAYVTDVSGAFAQINVQGPNARALLSRVTSADVSDAAFPFRAAREIDVGFARALCNRITYVGELGYELFVPTEHAVHVHDRLVAAGEADAALGFAHVGLKALGSLRLEKGYRDFGHDMDNMDSILEAGLGFTCDFDKAGGFVGKEAVLAEKERGTPRNRLVSVLLDDPEPLLYHAEVLLRDGVPVGDIRAASYGHTLGGAVGLALVESGDDGPCTPKYIREGKWEVDVAGTRVPATVSLRPLYDPKNERIKM